MKRSNPVLKILTAIFAAFGGCAAVLSGFIIIHTVFVGNFSSSDGGSVSSKAALIQDSERPEDSSVPVIQQVVIPESELPADVETAAVEDESEVQSSENTIPPEYYQALNRANVYGDTMHMLKADIYDLLVSEYGDSFSADAAQYAIDHITNDWESELPELSESVQADQNDAAMLSSDIQDPVSTEYDDNTRQTEEVPAAVIAETEETPQSDDSVTAGIYSTPETDVSMPADTMVWLSATGEKYHRINNCGRMNPARARQVTLEEAVSMGFGQCKNCY